MLLALYTYEAPAKKRLLEFLHSLENRIIADKNEQIEEVDIQ